MGTMTARERVRAALTHQQPDRVPMDLGGMNSSSMVVEGYERLKQHFGIEAETRLLDRMQRIVEIDESILQALAIDTRRVGFGAPDSGLVADLGTRVYRDMWGVVRQNPEGSYYFDLKECPLAGDITTADILKYPWPNPDDPGFVRGLKDRVGWFREHTDAAIVLTLPAPFIHISQYLRGFEDWFCDCAADMERLEVLFDAVMDVTLQLSRNMLREVGQDVDVLFIADDLGSQDSLIVSRDSLPEVYQAPSSEIRLSASRALACHDCAPFLRRGLQPDRRLHRHRGAMSEPRAAFGRGHEPGRAQTKVSGANGVLGGHRQPGHRAARIRRRGPEYGRETPRRIGGGGRADLRKRSQYPARCAPGECSRNVRACEGVRAVIRPQIVLSRVRWQEAEMCSGPGLAAIAGRRAFDFPPRSGARATHRPPRQGESGMKRIFYLGIA